MTTAAAELAAPARVGCKMASPVPPRGGRSPASPWHARPALLVALAVSLVLHALWSLWPVDFDASPPPPPLAVTLEEMPAPPRAEPPPPPPPQAQPTTQTKPAAPAAKPRKPRAERALAATKPAPEVAPPAPPAAPPSAQAPSRTVEAAPAPAPVIGPPADDAKPPVVLPPRLELAYKVSLGTQGFVIGAATYRFEHEGSDYRISTVAEPRGFAALFVHGRGLVESRGTITAEGLKPYEFALERGSSDKREVAYFDWDAGNVVLNGGTIATLEPPAFDPLTILWQPYFSPPLEGAQRYTIATTRRVTRYTLTLEAEEPIVWRHGQVTTQRWHQVSDDGRTEGWFWLAPSLNYIPIKMRVTRTSRGTLEAVLDAIRTDADGNVVDEPQTQDVPPAFKPAEPTAPFPGPDNTGQ